ncbi:MAG TPA: DNA cytosine methyltransferase, partial [Thermofilum sp.]|nr:DNA cytosine methyltransferase [Thermofilum sp.]
MYTIVDLFCGAGGFSRGFKDEGFKVILGVENLDIIAETFKKNFPEAVIIVEDIKNVHSKDIIEIVDEPDVVIGGPPCEAFTKANPRRKENPIDRLYSDPIGNLVLHFVRIVGDLRPKIFVMENVPGILEGELKHYLTKEFGRVGYEK